MNYKNPFEKIRPLAVVTGASSGIGYELARIFAENGFDLVVSAEDIGIFDAANTFKAFGGAVEPVRADLSTEDGVNYLYSTIKTQQSQLEAVAINAGVGVSGEFANTNLNQEINMINLNVISAVRLTKKVLPDMLAAGRGKLLFTSSIAAELPGPYFSVYAATKAFVQSFAEAIRNEVKGKGITVTALQPGPTDTNFFERAEMMDTKAGVGKKDDAADVAQDGFEAMMAGKDHVVAGSFKNKVQSAIAKFVPETTGAQMQAKQTKPGSAQH